jgi:hypothetical protein
VSARFDVEGKIFTIPAEWEEGTEFFKGYLVHCSLSLSLSLPRFHAFSRSLSPHRITS